MAGEAKCVQCHGELDTASLARCAKCLTYMREYARRRLGCQPWRPGGPGRPPLAKTQAAQP